MVYKVSLVGSPKNRLAKVVMKLLIMSDHGGLPEYGVSSVRCNRCKRYHVTRQLLRIFMSGALIQFS